MDMNKKKKTKKKKRKENHEKNLTLAWTSPEAYIGEIRTAREVLGTINTLTLRLGILGN